MGGGLRRVPDRPALIRFGHALACPDQGSTTSPRELVGEVLSYPGIAMAPDGSFLWDLDQLTLPGAANPIMTAVPSETELPLDFLAACPTSD